MNEHSDEDETDLDHNTLRPTTLIAGGVVALIVLMGLTITIISIGEDGSSDGKPSADGGTSQPTTQEPVTPSDPEASICGLPGHETQASLNAPPEDVKWKLVGKIAIPKSKTAGPGVIEDTEVRYCFAHTVEGAVLAAANLFAWDTSLRTDPVAVTERSIASGPGFDVAMKKAKAGTAAGDEDSSDLLLQIRGFRLLAYDGESALVDVVVQASNGALVHSAYELLWEQGDWRLRLGPDGSLPSAAPLPDLSGYVPWAGA